MAAHTCGYFVLANRRRMEDRCYRIVPVTAAIVPIQYFIGSKRNGVVIVMVGSINDIVNRFGFSVLSRSLFFGAVFVCFVQLFGYVAFTATIQFGFVLVFAKNGSHVCFVNLVPRHYPQLHRALKADTKE
jgi:hypothetical protein